jgi:hypothetical protein
MHNLETTVTALDSLMTSKGYLPDLTFDMTQTHMAGSGQGQYYRQRLLGTEVDL